MEEKQMTVSVDFQLDRQTERIDGLLGREQMFDNGGAV
jgi:hypothetical protein